MRVCKGRKISAVKNWGLISLELVGVWGPRVHLVSFPKNISYYGDKMCPLCYFLSLYFIFDAALGCSIFHTGECCYHCHTSG